MTGERRKYVREGEERRREALISSALDLVAEGGAPAATVRAIADRAGVTPGLIRHYFETKEDLTRAAYASVMQRMIADSSAVLAAAPADPAARLAVFVAASLRPPVVDPAALSIWAGFLHLVQRDPAMREVHRAHYLGYRDLLQGLIAALPRPADPATLRAQAIACNAVIDGLWLEGGALPEAFGPGELERIGLGAVGALLELDLVAALPPETAKDMP
ncbi:TetR family transcriptional regulator C-terminal domain-containing protein [Fertoebacter nigrum]|uniref:TetR family transcriptional regulator C-terminal domain-containing protein n=1 Tax=Fertoeibacter niger TaxID=2656921 RepID=A0A8X8KQR3_9RHOB|nr:TetR family transcriptional regulator C-terminal domain-containing protein [Fertoeibacter niger]